MYKKAADGTCTSSGLLAVADCPPLSGCARGNSILLPPPSWLWAEATTLNCCSDMLVAAAAAAAAATVPAAAVVVSELSAAPEDDAPVSTLVRDVAALLLFSHQVSIGPVCGEGGNSWK